MIQIGYGARSGAGSSAQARYEQRYSRWRRGVEPLVVVLCVPLGLLVLAPAVFWPGHIEFFAGLAVGAMLALYLSCMDDPPEHIDRWRRGAEGERMTARELRRLARTPDWCIRHDLAGRRGNRDHVVVGPTGVFLLETKRLGGEISVGPHGGLCVRWLEDPGDGYENRSVAKRLRGSAASLSEELARGAGIKPWVQPVVVIWGRFDGGPIEVAGIVFIAGKHLASWLQARNTALASRWRNPIASALARLS